MQADETCARRSIVLNRPMASIVSRALAQRLLFGASAGEVSPTRLDCARYIRLCTQLCKLHQTAHATVDVVYYAGYSMYCGH
jgi:hypothetical protein